MRNKIAHEPFFPRLIIIGFHFIGNIIISGLERICLFRRNKIKRKSGKLVDQLRKHFFIDFLHENDPILLIEDQCPVHTDLIHLVFNGGQHALADAASGRHRKIRAMTGQKADPVNDMLVKRMTTIQQGPVQITREQANHTQPPAHSVSFYSSAQTACMS